MAHRVRAAGILVENGRLLLVAEGTLATGEPYFIPPGGGLEPSDASLAQCVVREVWEETGIHVEVGEPVYIKEFFQPASQTHHVEIFFLVTRRPDVREDRVTPDRAFAWYGRAELQGLLVFPPALKDTFWDEWAAGTLRCRYLGRD